MQNGYKITKNCWIKEEKNGEIFRAFQQFCSKGRNYGKSAVLLFFKQAVNDHFCCIALSE
jgi:hypothetical protein